MSLSRSKREQEDEPCSQITQPIEGNDGETSTIKLRLIKSCVSISIGLSILYASYNALQDLQSSVNKQVGITSLWSLYTFNFVSMLTIANLLIGRFGVKCTLVVSALCYTPYIAAQYFPSYYTLVPGAILTGLAVGPLQVATKVYFAKAGEAYAETISIDACSGISRCNALFHVSTRVIGILGSFISSKVLSTGNYTENSEKSNQTCGAGYCPWFRANMSANGDSSDIPEEEQTIGLVTLTSICMALALAAPLIIAVFVDPLSRFGIDDAIDRPPIKQVLATLTHLKKCNQILLIPLSLFTGMSFGFVISEFTAAYVSCGMGPYMVGYVMMCLSISSTVFAYITALAQQKVGRLPLITLGALMEMTFFLVLLYWKPNRHQPVVFFIMAGVCGFTDAIWSVQFFAFCGVIFTDQGAAYSNTMLWQNIGIIVGLGTSGVMCVGPKVYMLLALLGAGMLGYYIIEIRERKRINVS